MILCIDVGNSHIFAGIFENDQQCLGFRCSSQKSTSDELGIFLRQALRENAFEPTAVKHIAICSVVPSIDYSLRSACLKYFSIDPFVLQAGVKTGLKINYRHPTDVGADRIANAMAAVQLFPKQHCIIVDFGTATTFCAVSKEKEYLGGAILPGMRLSMQALQSHTAKLPPVEIVRMPQTIGRSTIESIQVGLYHGTLGACREILHAIAVQTFQGEACRAVATGGFAHLFIDTMLFDEHVPNLVLQGLYRAWCMNA